MSVDLGFWRLTLPAISMRTQAGDSRSTRASAILLAYSSGIPSSHFILLRLHLRTRKSLFLQTKGGQPDLVHQSRVLAQVLLGVPAPVADVLALVLEVLTRTGDDTSFQSNVEDVASVATVDAYSSWML
jgi:hypothetical protein